MGYVVNKRRFKQSSPTPSEYKVTITGLSHINHTGGDIVQTVSGPITPIILSPEDTYRINQSSGTYSGITVAVDGKNRVISGTPTKNVTLYFGTSQNSNILTSTQTNITNWTNSAIISYGFRFRSGVQNYNIPWEVVITSSYYTRNEGYYYDLSSLPTDTPFQFSLKYREAQAGSGRNEGCKIGISTTNSNGSINTNMLGAISISGTQAEFITETVNITRPSSASNCYLAIVNTNYDSRINSYSGQILYDQMSLREI